MNKKNAIGCRLALLVASILLAASQPGLVPASASQDERNFSELESVILDELKANGTPGASFAIVSGDRVIYAKGFGVANVETSAPVTPDMLFRLGSTTKMFTGAALVRLAEEGRIKLDAPVGEYIRWLDPRIARVTVHHLLSNTSGMRDFAAPFVSHDDSALSRTVRDWKGDVFFTEPGRPLRFQRML